MITPGRVRSLVCLILFICCISTITRSSTQAGDLSNSVESQLRVMSFNIRYGTASDGPNHWNDRKELLVSTIRNFAPDLLGTQETLAMQRDYLLKELPEYQCISAGRDNGDDRGEMAAIFYKKERFQESDHGHFWLSPTPDKVGSKGWDAALPRMVTWVKLVDVKAPEMPQVLFFNTHFDHKGSIARSESAFLLKQKIGERSRDCSTIVTGDFNAGIRSQPYEVLFGAHQNEGAILVDTFAAKHGSQVRQQGTFSNFIPANRSGERIDWIGNSRDFQIIDCQIDYTEKDGRVPSDHFPVTAILSR